VLLWGGLEIVVGGVGIVGMGMRVGVGAAA